MYDVIVVGGGPAGMTAALYALRNGKSVLVIEKNGFGGQITHSPKVENYPGTLQMSGNEFAERMLDQILAQGADITIETVTGLDMQTVDGIPEVKLVHTEEGETYQGRTVILATGVKHRMLGLPGEADMVGEGISFCAVCDGDFYSGQKVCVAGGGNSALQEAILLAEKCSEVILLQDMPFFTGEQKLQETLFAKPHVRAFVNQKITGLLTGPDGFAGVTTLDKVTGEERQIPCDGLFVAIGLIPENEPFKDVADLNAYGYFDADEECLTRTPGVFVAGDCRSKKVRQITTAASDGATAALAACWYLNRQ
ncbi:MAG: FAD-dependent oxidoreductase [Firmicutes bacterium]|nr:FAD-dependent oxidoreductase [Bacillota bacterium]